MKVNKIRKRLKEITSFQIFILLVVALGFIFLVKFFGLGEEWKTVRIEVIGKQWGEDWSQGFPISTSFRPQPWLARDVVVGDGEYGVDGKKIAEIINIEEYGDRRAALYITANLKVVYKKRTKKYAFKNKSIETGSVIELLLPEAKIEGQIVDINAPTEGYEKKKIIVTGRIRNADPWFVEKVTVGDRMLNKTNSNTVAEILNVRTEPASSSVFFTNPGTPTNLFLDRVENRRDIIITLEAEVQKLREGWRFAGNQIVKVSSPLVMSFPEYEIYWLEVQDYQNEAE